MQAYPFALNGRPNCLFKWQVILSKQITPANPWIGVVFLPQIVALPNKTARNYLLSFTGLILATVGSNSASSGWLL
jgi:hypothetical protein